MSVKTASINNITMTDFHLPLIPCTSSLYPFTWVLVKEKPSAATFSPYDYCYTGDLIPQVVSMTSILCFATQ